MSSAPQEPVVGLRRKKVRAGTGDMSRGLAASRADVEAALAIGAEAAKEAVRAGADAIALGEIGIGNTTAAAALTAVFARRAPDQVVGSGTGVAGEVLARKLDVVVRALALHQPDARDPIGVLAAVGGLEIAAVAGCALEAARQRVPIVLDGFVTNAAALAAVRLDPEVRSYLLASHASTERGARFALEALRLEPLLELGMRLGEGTGAVLGISLLRAAVTTLLSMATFATAGVVGLAGRTSEGPP